VVRRKFWLAVGEAIGRSPAPRAIANSPDNGLKLKLGMIGLSLMGLLVGCSSGNGSNTPEVLNSRYNDEQPALSGNGRLLAFASNRNGRREILLYDLQRRQFVDLPGLNRGDAIAENPSLSYTGRYLTYTSSAQGRAEIELYDRITQRSQTLSMGYRGWVRNSAISPDGRYIVFETGNRGQWDVEVLDRGESIELDRPDGK